MKQHKKLLKIIKVDMILKLEYMLGGKTQLIFIFNHQLQQIKMETQK